MRKSLIVPLAAVAVLVAVALPSHAIRNYVCQDQHTEAVDAVAVSSGPTCSFQVDCPTGCDIELSGSAGGIGTVGVLIQTAGAAIGTGCFGVTPGCAAPNRIGHLSPGTYTVYAQWTGATGVNPVPAPLVAASVLASIRAQALVTP